MLKNVLPVADLRSLARRKMNPLEFKSIPSGSYSDELLADGWEVQREGKTATRICRSKARSVLLEDRVWSLLYRLGFDHLSGEGGAQLLQDPKAESSPYNQIDVVGLDPEVALAVECKSAEQPRKYTEFQKDLAKHVLTRQRFGASVSNQFPLPHKRVALTVMFTWDLILTENDEDRAKNENVVLLNDRDLHYYEQLASHLGPAAKYQFFADMLPGRRIHGLEIKIPALQSKLGKYTCYTFSISPEYLLKIAYVSHRAKGKATDVNTYQRMIKKSRLKKIREYIDQNGIFPTNIVVSLEGKRHVNFEPWAHNGGKEVARHGLLVLTPSYRCAWIIDGQHRLFGYSGREKAKTSHLSVLAFEGLPASKQAQLFIDINHEQKSVKRSLLQELYAELNWDAEDEDKRVSAIVSKVVQVLNEDKQSPFYSRILFADETRTETRCITLENFFRVLNQPGMFTVKKSVEYGPFWTGDNDTTLKRVVQITTGWFELIREAAPEWWQLGAAEGGGLSMNDGVTVCMGVLRSVLQHLGDKLHFRLIQLSNDEILKVLQPYGEALGHFLAGKSAAGRAEFRAGARGNQGQTAMRRKCEQALNAKFPAFEPPGLSEDLKLQEARTNDEAFRLITQIEKALHEFIIGSLKLEYGSDASDPWWYQGVQEQIRKKATARLEEEHGKGKKEQYLDLIDFRTMAVNNWSLFQETLAFGKSGNKEARTAWMQKLNEMRKVVMHPAKQQSITFEQLAELREYQETLTQHLEAKEEAVNA
jgi:DGQHR domain-containing protein